jgi:hypothetical protein
VANSGEESDFAEGLTQPRGGEVESVEEGGRILKEDFEEER